MRRYRLLTVFLATGVCLASTHAMATKVHEEIKGPLATPWDVTKKCLECHNDAGVEIMTTQHWNWMQQQTVNGKSQLYGKKVAMTNFGIAVEGNWPRCTSCHIGYGWKDESFDFTDKANIDCLVCHDTTGTYQKAKEGAGLPKGFTEFKERGKPVNLLEVARHVGKPSKVTCGTCHFGGCGAARVKHGDLDPSFAGPSVDIDIHMAADGKNFDCQACHYPEKKHNIIGHYMVPSLEGTYQSGCVDCHTDKPHALNVLNSHYEAIACQTCHIPTYARQYAAKTEWDWSKGEREISAISADTHGRLEPVKGVGGFTWGQNLIPTYEWYDGTENVYLLGDTIDPDKVTYLNKPQGSLSDKHSKIYPFKVVHGRQIFDKKYKYLITPHITKKGETAFWKTYDWDTSAKVGMDATGLAYSGKYGFTETVMYWRINHGVVAANQALDCLDCHGQYGRLDWERLGYEGDPWKVKGLYRCSPEFEAESLRKVLEPK